MRDILYETDYIIPNARSSSTLPGDNISGGRFLLLLSSSATAPLTSCLPLAAAWEGPRTVGRGSRIGKRDTGLLGHLAHRAIHDGLPQLQGPPREGPAPQLGRLGAPDQQHLRVQCVPHPWQAAVRQAAG